MLASSGDRMPPCGVPVSVPSSAPSTVRIPAFRNAFARARTRLSPTLRRTRSIRAVWSIESKHASMSASQHPAVTVVVELVDLSDRVLRPAPRAEAIGAWLEIRLEDRLEHQLQGRLHDPVPDGRDGGFIPLLLLTRLGLRCG